MARQVDLDEEDDGRREVQGRGKRRRGSTADDALNLFGLKVDSKRLLTWIAAGGAGWGTAELVTDRLVPLEYKAWSPWAFAAAGLVTALNTKGQARDLAIGFCVGSALDGVARTVGFTSEAWRARQQAKRNATSDLAVLRAQLQEQAASAANTAVTVEPLVAALREEIATLKADSLREETRLAEERERARSEIETLQREIRVLHAQLQRERAKRRPPASSRTAKAMEDASPESDPVASGKPSNPSGPLLDAETQFGIVLVGTRVQLPMPFEEAQRLTQRIAEMAPDAVMQLERELLGMSPAAGLAHLRRRLLRVDTAGKRPPPSTSPKTADLQNGGTSQISVDLPQVVPEQARHLEAIRQRLSEDTALVQALANVPESGAPNVIERLLTMSVDEGIAFLRSLVAVEANRRAVAP